MKIKFILLLTLSFTILFAERWIQYGDHQIDSKIIVIKLNKDSAPLLGYQEPFNIKSDLGFVEFLKTQGAISITPLF